MKKILLLVISFCVLFSTSLSSLSAYNIDKKLETRIDKKLELFYQKIDKRDLDSQLRIYKKLKTKVNLLKNKYKIGLKLELINYVYDEVKKKYSKVFKEYILINNVRKDLSYNFILKQDIDNTYLFYKKKQIYSWSHKINKNPFIWDEGCDLFSEKLNTTKKVDKQTIWESLGIENQKKCMKQYYSKSISISKIGNNFYKINTQGYEAVNIKLFSLDNYKVYDKLKVPLDKIKKIKVGRSGIFIQYVGNRGHDGGVLFIDKNTDEQKILFHNTDDEDYIEVINFELLLNKKVKIFYKLQNGTKKEVIVDLNEK